MKAKRKTWITTAALLCMAIPVISSAAQAPVIPAMQFGFAESSESDGARDVFNSGQESFDAGKYAQAEASFREVVRKWPKSNMADRSAYWLIRTLGEQGKVEEAKKQIADFQKTYKASVWLKDVLEYQIKLTNPGNSGMADYVASLKAYAQALAPPPPAAPTPAAAPPAPPAPRGPSQAAFERAFRDARRGSVPENPELTVEREALRVLFESNPDRATEIASERLKNDPNDELVLSSLNLFANSKSDKAFAMLVSIAKTSPDPKGRRDAVYWISRSRSDNKDAITDLLIGLVPSMTSDEDSNAVLYALSQVNTPKAYDALAGMARDKNRPENVRLAAIQRLGETRLPNRVNLLDDIYKSSSDDVRVRRQVVSVLGRGKEPEVVNILAGIAANDSDFTVRTAAVNSIGQIKTPEAQKALEDFLLKKKP